MRVRRRDLRPRSPAGHQKHEMRNDSCQRESESESESEREREREREEDKKCMVSQSVRGHQRESVFAVSYALACVERQQRLAI